MMQNCPEMTGQRMGERLSTNLSPKRVKGPPLESVSFFNSLLWVILGGNFKGGKCDSSDGNDSER